MEEKNKVGRPTKYDPKYCGMLIEHFKKGHSLKSFGATIGVHPATVFRWLSDKDDEGKPLYPEFLEAREIANSYGLLFYEKIGLRGVRGFKSEDMPGFNVTAWIFIMKNRFNWRDKKDVTTNDKPIANNVIELTDEDLIKQLPKALDVIKQISDESANE